MADEENSKALKGKDFKAWHEKAMRDFDNAYGNSESMRKEMIETQRFVRIPKAQWEGSTVAGFEFGGERFDKYPRFTLNKVAKEIKRLVGEYRRNRISTKFRPTDYNSSEELADKLNGKLRADMNETQGGEALDNAYDEGLAGGMGCFRLDAPLVDEFDPGNNDRRVGFYPVYDAASCVFFDPNSKNYDRSDALWAVEIFSMEKDAFEEQYPNKDASPVEKPEGANFDWNANDLIYVARYYRVRVEPTTVTEYTNTVTNDTAIYDDEQLADEDLQDYLADEVFKPGKSRKVKRRRVYCGIMSGKEWLEEPERIPGNYIPLVPFYADRAFVDGSERIKGHATDALDAQRLENLMVSMLADTATQSSGDNIPIVDVDMIPGPMMHHWSNRNVKRPAFLPMKSLRDKDGNVVAPAAVTQFTPPTQISPALAALLQYTSATIPDITGSSNVQNIPSNIATDTVDALFERLDGQSFLYMDNLAKSLKHAGNIWLAMAREVYGSDKPVRIVGEDGTDSVTLLEGKIYDKETNQPIGLDDLSVSKFEVTSDVGKSYATGRRMLADKLLQLLPIVPQGTPQQSIVLGMLVDALDGEGMEDFKKWNRKQLIAAGVVQPQTEAEKTMLQQQQEQEAQQAQQPDAEMIAAQGMLLDGQSKMARAQTDQMKLQLSAQELAGQQRLTDAQVVKTVAEAQNIDRQSVLDALAILTKYEQQQRQAEHNSADLLLRAQQQGHSQGMDLNGGLLNANE